MTNLELHIEELVLHGLAPGMHARLAAAVEDELVRLLAVQGIPPWLSQGGALATLDGGTFTVSAGSQVEAVGAQVAQAVYGSLSQ